MKVNSRELLEKLIFVAFIYLNGSLWAVDGISGIQQFAFKTILILVVIVAKNPRFKMKNVRFTVFLLAMMLMTMLTAGIYFDLDVAAILNLLFALVIISSYSEEVFAYWYCKIMGFLACCSLVGFTIYYVARGVLNAFPQVVWHAGIRFANMIVTLVPLTMEDYFRNWGIFREPGFYSVFLIIALVFELFSLQKPKKAIVYIEIVSLVTTFSTMGIVALILVLAAYILDRKDVYTDKKWKKRLIAAVIVILCVVGLWMLFTSDGQLMFARIFGKVWYEKSTNVSYINRQLGIKRAVSIFENNVLFGGGYISVVGGEIDFTELLWFAIYGVLFGIVCNLYYLIYPLKYGKSRMSKLLLMVTFFVIAYSQSIETSMLTFIILLYSFDGGIYKRRNIIP